MRTGPLQAMTQLKTAKGKSTTAIARKCPAPSGTSVASTAEPRRSVRPLATASGQPIAGLSP